MEGRAKNAAAIYGAGKRLTAVTGSTNELRVDTSRYTNPADCLAAWLLMEGAGVFSGIKPGSLINLSNRLRPCGRNLYDIWKSEGVSLLRSSNIKVLVMADRGDSLLLFLYAPLEIDRLLKRTAVQRMLVRSGYPADADRTACLEILSQRCSSTDFPHEIGIFLGYPLKDVAGFMGLCKTRFACQGSWKIYGDPSPSLDLAAAFRRCRDRMALQLRLSADTVCDLYAKGRPVFLSAH